MQFHPTLANGLPAIQFNSSTLATIFLSGLNPRCEPITCCFRRKTLALLWSVGSNITLAYRSATSCPYFIPSVRHVVFLFLLRFDSALCLRSFKLRFMYGITLIPLHPLPNSFCKAYFEWGCNTIVSDCLHVSPETIETGVSGLVSPFTGGGDRDSPEHTTALSAETETLLNTYYNRCTSSNLHPPSD